MTFDTIMNREVDTSYVRVTEVFETSNDGARTYLGISTEMIAGIGDSASFAFTDGYFSGLAPKPIASDWSATVVIRGGNTYTYNQITVDEGIANGGLGEFQFDWVSLHGQGYLDRGDFFNGDGCYTFEVTLENEHGETFVSTDSRIEFYWEANEASSSSDDDKPAEGC